VLVVVALAAAALIVPSPARAGSRQKQVLVLYTTRRDAQIVTVGDREIPQLLSTNLGRSVDYYSEFIDLTRSRDPEYQVAFRDFLLLKYRGQHFDVVIAMSTVALDFVDRYRRTLFPETPVVFFIDRERPLPVADAVGIFAPLNLKVTVDLAVALQPDISHVFVVSGADGADQSYEALARRQLQALEPRMDVTYLSALPTKQLFARLTALPEHSMVFYLLVNRDGAGEYFHPLEYLDRVSKTANAPTYCWVGSAMDHGIVGGSLRDQRATTGAVATLALRVLRGERIESVTTSTALQHLEIDWRQLRRWNIRTTNIPAAATIRFRESSLWERYRRQVAGTIALVLAQTALIAALLVQRRTRRRAELEARWSRAELHSSYEHIRDLAGRLLHAQEIERSRIARELHDDIGQELALLTIELELANGLGLDLDEEKERVAFSALSRAHHIAKVVHDLSHSLHPARLHLLGLVAALDGLRRELSGPNVRIAFTHQNVPASLPSDTILCLFRVAQEALQNAIRHGAAREIFMRLTATETQLALIVIDNGVGFDVESVKGGGLGLVSMRERLEAIDGTLLVRSSPGAGTRLEILVPYAAPHAAGEADVRWVESVAALPPLANQESR
jgi:signal transduction histidine kinase